MRAKGGNQSKYVRNTLPYERSAESQRAPSIVLFVLVPEFVIRRARAELRRECAYSSHSRAAYHGSVFRENLVRFRGEPQPVVLSIVQNKEHRLAGWRLFANEQKGREPDAVIG